MLLLGPFPPYLFYVLKNSRLSWFFRKENKWVYLFNRNLRVVTKITSEALKIRPTAVVKHYWAWLIFNASDVIWEKAWSKYVGKKTITPRDKNWTATSYWVWLNCTSSCSMEKDAGCAERGPWPFKSWPHRLQRNAPIWGGLYENNKQKKQRQTIW